MSETEASPLPQKISLAERLARFRVPLLIAAVLLGVLLALLAGLGLGRAKLALERKQFVERATQFNEKLAELEKERILFEAKEKSLQQKLMQQASRIDQLEAELAVALQSMQKAQAAAASTSAAQNPDKSAARQASEPVKRYVRFGNVDCKVTSGKGNHDWQSCLQQGRPGSVARPASQ